MGTTSAIIETGPRTCGHGHRLGPGRVTRAWYPCPTQCATRDSSGGHSVVICRACKDDGWTMVMTDHVRSGEDVLLEMQPVQAGLDRIEREIDRLGPNPRNLADRERARRVLEAMEAVRAAYAAEGRPPA